MTNLGLLYFWMSKQHKYNLFIETDYDYDMIGICSHHSDYRLVWGLNELLKMNLAKAEDYFVVAGKKGTGNSNHSYYFEQDEENMMEIYLIKNKSENKFLIPEKQQIDYFLFLRNNRTFSIKEWVEKIKSHPSVLTAFEFDPQEFASTEHILFD